MRRTLGTKISMAILAGALILTGCAKGTKTEGQAESGTKVEAEAKPPLVIPASFASEAEKREFATQAVKDEYYKEAAPLLEQALSAEPTGQGYRYLGLARYKMKDYDGAIAAWTKASEVDPELAGEMKNYIGNAYRDNRNGEEAKKAYREALELEPTRWNAAVNLATLLKMEDNLADAVAVLEAAAKNNSNIPPLLTMLESYQKDLNPQG